MILRRQLEHRPRPWLPTIADTFYSCRGVTLLEVLIALVVLSVGLLGLAGLQTASLQFNTNAYQHTHATVLANVLVEHMRANRQAALNDDFNGGFENPAPACTPGENVGGSPAEILAAWRNTLACQLPQGTGAVRRSGNEFTVSVQWSDGRDEPLSIAVDVTTAL